MKKKKVEMSKYRLEIFFFTFKKKFSSISNDTLVRSISSVDECDKRPTKKSKKVDDNDDKGEDETSDSDKKKGKKNSIIDMSEETDDDDDDKGTTDVLSAIAKSPNFKNKANIGRTSHEVLVVGPIAFKDAGFIWVVSFNYTNSPWYFLDSYPKAWYESLWDTDHEQKKGKYPAWIVNFKGYQVRKMLDPSNEIEVKSNGYPISHTATVVVTKTDDREAFMKQMKVCDAYRKRIFALNYDKGELGQWYYDYLQQRNETRIIEAMKYMGDDPKVRIKQITKELKPYGHILHDYKYGYTLDHFWTDFAIKEFITKWYGVFSFEEVDEDVLKHCYRNYPGTRKLPIWSGIVEQIARG